MTESEVKRCEFCGEVKPGRVADCDSDCGSMDCDYSLQDYLKDSEGPDTPEEWVKYWKEEIPDFHSSEVNPSLEKYYRNLTGRKTGLRVLVPLCGKSVDLLWLADQGQLVVGVEISELAVKSFFDENNLEYTVEENSGIPTYRAKQNNITLYQCDILQLTTKITGGKFSAIWDRGALSSLTKEMQKKYVAVVGSLLLTRGRWLIETFEVTLDDLGEVAGKIFTPEDFKWLFAAQFKDHVLDSTNDHGIDWMQTAYHLLTWKD